MKTRMILLLLACYPGFAYAQKIRYKDLFPQMETMNAAELKNSLKEYLADDPDHPNANFTLALLYASNCRTADILTDYDFAWSNADQAVLRFGKAKQVIDEREVNRNTEYYFPTFKTLDAKGKPSVSFIQVSKKIDDGRDSCAVFLQKIPSIYRNFTRSVICYDKAVKIFAKINDDFLNLDDLYMLYNDSLDRRMSELKQSYDSAKIYLDQYGKLIEEYPIPYHKQKYFVKPIVTYRLDGLITRMNFLTDRIDIWDYASWVDHIRQSVKTDIGSMRSRLVQNQEKLDASFARLNDTNVDGFVPFKLEKQLVFNLNNYDKQSVALSLLEYRAFKQNWIFQSKIMQPDSANASRNAEIYSTLIYVNRSADTLIGVVKNRLTPDKIRKHNDFLLKYYGNAGAIEQFTTSEQSFVKKSFGDYSAHLQSELMRLALSGLEVSKPPVSPDPKVPVAPAKMVKFTKLTVPLVPSLVTAEWAAKGDPITLETKKGPDGTLYLVGIYKPDKKTDHVVTYIGQVTADGKPTWIKNFDLKFDSLSATSDGNHFPGTLALTKEGCAFILHSSHVSQPDNRKNTFVYVNDKGEDKFKIVLKEKTFPRKLNYNEKSNSFVIVFKGVEEKTTPATSEPASILGVNVLGDILWTRSIELSGNITELVNVIDGYMVFGNFMVIRDLGGKEIRTKTAAGEANPFIVKLGTQGDLLKILPVQVPHSVYLVKVIKVSDNSINLLVWDGTFESGLNRTLTAGDGINYLMTNHQCELVSSSF